MCQHNIFLANSYNKVKRIALDLVFPDINSDNLSNYQKILADFSSKLFEKTGSIHGLTSHTICTNSPNWQSVVEADSFFDDVLLVKDIDEFVSLIEEGSKLTSMDFKLLIYFLMCKNKIVFVDRDDAYQKVIISYRDLYKKDLYAIDNADKNMPDDEKIEKMSGVVIDKVLSSENGFAKFKHVLNSLHHITKSPLFL